MTVALTTFALRLKQIIGQESVHAFAKRAGVSDTCLRSYLKGSVPSIDKAVQIARTAQVNVHWLITGEGRDTDPDWTAVQSDYVYIPFLDVAASAGAGLAVLDEAVAGVIAFDSGWLRSRLKSNPADLSIITVQGDSMAPTLLDGEMIFVDHKINDLRDGIYIFQMDGDLLVKRLQKLPGSRIGVMSDNPRFQSFTVDMQDPDRSFKVIGRYRGKIALD